MKYTTLVDSVVAPGSIMTCSRCSHKWAIRKRGDLPKNCPRCRSTLWMKNYHVYTCLKCEHSWGTANECPMRCPKCHTSKWNTPVVVNDVKSEPIQCKLPQEDKEKIFRMYALNKGCVAISIDLGIPFSEVIESLLERNPEENVRL